MKVKLINALESIHADYPLIYYVLALIVSLAIYYKIKAWNWLFPTKNSYYSKSVLQMW